MKFSVIFAFAISLTYAQTWKNRADLNFTSFNFVKNTNFHLPCDATDLLYNPLGAFSLSPKPPLTSPYYHARNRQSFCRRFTLDFQPYPIATTPTRAAFLPGWPTSLIGIVSAYVSFIISLNYLEDHDNHITSGTLFWSVAIFDLARLVVWWIIVVQSAQDFRTAGYPSVILWIVPIMYAALSSSIRGMYSYWLSALVLLYTFVHWGMSLAIIIVRWKVADVSAASYLPLQYKQQASDFPALCAHRPFDELPGDLFTDPGVRWYRVAQTVQFAFCSFFVLGYVCGGVERNRVDNMLRSYLPVLLVYGYFILLRFQLARINLPGAAFRVAPNDGACGLVVIMMKPRLGFLDVKYNWGLRIAGSVLAVY